MKFHILDCADMPKRGSTIMANCGAKVANVEFVFIWDSTLASADDFNVRHVCRECLKFKPTHRYLCGIVNGQEMKTEVA